jgi:peptide-methionine (R)-S-oxide reductase
MDRFQADDQRAEDSGVGKVPGRQQLTDLQRYLFQDKGTERPYSGRYVDHDDDGVYTCAWCGSNLFRSEAKFESTMPGLMGWPAFSDAFDPESVELREDHSLGMNRTEVVCKGCGGHLGHLFDDPSAPDNTHYCVNSTCLLFEKADEGPSKPDR